MYPSYSVKFDKYAMVDEVLARIRNLIMEKHKKYNYTSERMINLNLI